MRRRKYADTKFCETTFCADEFMRIRINMRRISAETNNCETNNCETKICVDENLRTNISGRINARRTTAGRNSVMESSKTPYLAIDEWAHCKKFICVCLCVLRSETLYLQCVGRHATSDTLMRERNPLHHKHILQSIPCWTVLTHVSNDCWFRWYIAKMVRF